MKPERIPYRPNIPSTQEITRTFMEEEVRRLRALLEDIRQHHDCPECTAAYRMHLGAPLGGQQ